MKVRGGVGRFDIDESAPRSQCFELGLALDRLISGQLEPGWLVTDIP